MQEEKFISEFWKSNERSNFSKEATVLFFYLIYIWKNENKPGKVLCASGEPALQGTRIYRKRCAVSQQGTARAELHQLHGTGKGLVFGGIQPVYGTSRTRERDNG
ncbi:hypothetical protein NXW48_22995 [Phocaeicola vulgatus]|nr:hypothetical protein [Phocaeicola vulgatus]